MISIDYDDAVFPKEFTLVFGHFHTFASIQSNDLRWTLSKYKKTKVRWHLDGLFVDRAIWVANGNGGQSIRQRTGKIGSFSLFSALGCLWHTALQFSYINIAAESRETVWGKDVEF